VPTENFELVGSYNFQRVIPLDPERSVNLFEYIDPLGKKPKSLLSTSGIVNSDVVFSTINGAFRTQFVFQGVNEATPNMYVVIGFDAFRIDPSLIPTLIFSFTSASNVGYVGIDANTHEVIFVDGNEGWIWDTSTSVATQITDANFPPAPIDVTTLDGFFVVANGGTNQFRLSQFNDGLLWTPLQQGTIQSHPGNIVACRTLHRLLFLFSANFTEVWENQGIGANLPFRRINSLLMEVGTPAIGSISTGFGSLFFLSQDKDGLGSVMQVIGSQPIPISNRALDFALSQYAEVQQISDARGFLIKENGLIFYRLNFTAANHTYVYNMTLSDPSREDGKLWHEEEVLNGDRHPAQTHAYFNGKNYVGSYLEPIMYLIDNVITTNDGEAIRRMRISRSVVPPGYQRLRIDRFQLDLLQGQFFPLDGQIVELILFTESIQDILTELGDQIIAEQFLTTIANNINPLVYMSISKDGGQTFGYLNAALMGRIGQRSYRTLWRKLGTIPRGQGFVIKIEFYEEIPFQILGSSWSYEILPE